MSYGSFASNYNNPLSNLGGGFANAHSGIKGAFSKFRNNKMVAGTTEFLYSNSLVAKVCFLILIIVLFVLALRLGSRILLWLMSPEKNPILINGLKDAKKKKIVSVDPITAKSKPILRSVNERDGLEFTWSVWLYIDSLAHPGEFSDGRDTSKMKKHIFNKGSASNIQGGDKWRDSNISGMAFPNNGPGLYIHENKNALVVVMNTFNNVIEEVEIDDVPLHKWINVVLRVKGKNMDSYINGTIVNRHVFSSVPKQNYGDVYVNDNGGYSGLLSSLRYYSYALTGVEIEELVKAGPNMTADDSLRVFPPYFSLRWFFSSDVAK